MDVEGIPPAKLYYDEHGVTFPALVDPNYATQFGAVPKTFFVNEHGVVQQLKGWEKHLDKPVRPVTDAVREKWSKSSEIDAAQQMGRLARIYEKDPDNLMIATELGSRYLAAGLPKAARGVLRATVKKYDAHQVATSTDKQKAALLGQAYLQLARATLDNRDQQVEYATLSYYLNPSIGFAKQIARLIAPNKFDHRQNGDFDNEFREATRRRLEKQRRDWLKAT